MNAMLEEEVSERQAAEDLLLENHQALLVSENRYRGLFDHMKKAFIYCKLLLDRDGAVIDGEILDVNHSFIEQFCRLVPGFSWSGRKISEVSCNELKLVFDCLKEYGSQVLQPTSLSFERILEVGDKCYQISAYSPEPYYVATLITDITEQRRITAEVEENRRRYEALMMQSSEAVLVVDFNSKIITEANNASLRVFGYEREELLSMPLSDLLMISEDSLQSLVAMLARFGGLPAAIRSCRRKDGSKIQLERVASLIEYSGKRLILISYRDVTEQQKLQAILQGELELAGTMQKSLLPAEFNNELVAIRTVFQPLHFVSGDYYGYKWSRSKQQLHGYIIDVTGHGIATALHTASISSLLNETMEKEQGWTPTAFLELNRYCLEYFPENAFVAMIAFTFDFAKQTLTYITGGINYIIACTQSDIGLMPLRGLYLGITSDPDFEFVTIPLQHGDLFYFMTDGIYERLPDSFFNGICQFSETVEALKRLSQDGQRFDDCSALCIEVRAWPEKKQHFNFSQDEYTALRRDQVKERLYKLAGSEGPKLEIVLGEALNNALAYGTKVKVTIQKIGQRLVIRVKDDGPGFLGNAAIESLGNQSSPELFETKLDAECGRGLGIMAAWTDKVLYSQRGNEVLIIKNLP
ncbi:MAG: PAS domain S-box protein [Sporomusaceae bacterium]|nr:PAS domain S-box protein [Sporomusaceae bacterium]